MQSIVFFFIVIKAISRNKVNKKKKSSQAMLGHPVSILPYKNRMDVQIFNNEKLSITFLFYLFGKDNNWISSPL